MTIWHHEPWFDETQAWLIVRDCNIFHVLGHVLRYEDPSLWYFLLAVPAKLGFPCGPPTTLGLRMRCWALPSSWRRGPFPSPCGIIAALSFLSYQYAVISRNYVLIPPLLFTLAVIYPRKSARPLDI